MSWPWIAWALLGYSCGSIPFAWLLAKSRGIDIRRQGSGNVGATNVARTLGRKWGVLCFTLDLLKGFGPVLGAGLAMGVVASTRLNSSDSWWWLLVATGAVLGHVFPCWLGFRGGKGVATGLGALLGFWPFMTLTTLAAALTWLIVAAVSRYVSLASIIAVGTIPFYIWLVSRLPALEHVDIAPFMIASGLMALLVLIRHRSNLARIIAGAEHRIGTPKATDHPDS